MATRDIATATNLEDEVVYPFFAAELLFSSSELRFWTGLGNLSYEGNDYIGVGNLLDISSIEETSEIAVRGATLTLSGIKSDVISLALQEPYQGRVCKIYFGTLAKGALLQEDGSFLLLENGSKISLETQKTALTEIFSGYMDEMNIDEGAEFSTIELKVENKLIDLERARVARYTSQYQKSKHPDDLGFDFVESIQLQDTLWGTSGNRETDERFYG